MKILLYDIESFAHKADVWGKYEQNVLKFLQYGSIASVAYRWLGESKVHVISRRHFKDKSDKSLLKAFHRILSEATHTIAHNGDEFDVKMLNAHFAKHRLPPCPKTVQIDTKKLAKKYFRFPGNSLNDLGDFLQVGHKVEHTGYSMWKDCEAGVKKAWDLMEKYNKQDVVLLEEVYKVIRPWITRQPGISLASAAGHCDRCDSPMLTKRGYNVTKKGKRQRYQCQSCGGWQ